MLLFVTPYLKNNQILIYFERRNFENIETPVFKKFKQFPNINLKLPHDFFYPFSCKALTNHFTYLYLIMPLLILNKLLI